VIVNGGKPMPLTRKGDVFEGEGAARAGEHPVAHPEVRRGVTRAWASRTPAPARRAGTAGSASGSGPSPAAAVKREAAGNCR